MRALVGILFLAASEQIQSASASTADIALTSAEFRKGPQS